MAEYIVEFDKTQYDQIVSDGVLKEADNPTLYGMPVQGEIIRCRDCKFFDPNVDEYIGEDGSNPKCNRLTYVFEKHHGGVKWLHRPTVSPDGFCAWAERDA